MSKTRRPPRAPGHGAAIAGQLGLVPGGEEEEEEGGGLEAELLALLGGAPPHPPPRGEKPQGRAPLPMEAIEQMAALCMRDPPAEEEEDEDEEDLMAELQEVLGDGGGGGGAAPTPPPPVQRTVPDPPSDPEGLERLLRERAALYRAAIGGAGGPGDAPRLRRYQRGLKTLETLLSEAKKGKKIREEEIPPPVALGKGVTPPPPPPAPSPPRDPPETPPQTEAKPTPPPSPSPPPAPPGPGGGEGLLRDRLRGYKLEALRAKRRGDLEVATKLFRVAKGLEPLLEQGGPLELSLLPPPPEQMLKELQETPPPPRPATPPRTDPPDPPPPAPPGPQAPPQDTLAALQQRMERYRGAGAGAAARGEPRKARMHQRILGQYQAAIRDLQAGKHVDLSQLPVPPGFPPLPGTEAPAGGGSLGGLLEAAAQLAAQDPPPEEEEEEEEEEGPQEAKAPPGPAPVRAPQPKQPPRASAPPNPAGGGNFPPKNASRAQQQLAFLEGRRRGLLEAARGALGGGDGEGARGLLRQARGLQPLLEAARCGLPVDIAKVPEPPLNKELFVLGPCRGGAAPPEAAGQYLEMVKVLRQQHEMCRNYARQFIQLGNIGETTRLEALARECRQQMETLRQAHARGCPPPRHRYEQRAFSLVKMFPELSSSDLLLCIVRGIDLPPPPGVAPRDLDTFVRFEFPHPSAEEAQKDKTPVVKSTDCPEFRQQFQLELKRGGRGGLRRLLRGKGIRFEVLHKGGLLRGERALGWAQLRLEELETTCELRESLQLLEGRRPTGGRLEVGVRIREPLGPPQLETRTEPWLVIDPAPPPPPAPKPKPAPPGEGNNRAVPPLPSLALLAFDREKLERKMQSFRRGGRPVPPELQQQHQQLLRRSQSLREGLQRGGPPSPAAYRAQLERYLQLFTEAARRLGTQGNREAAKEALYKRNLVENELQKLRQ